MSKKRTGFYVLMMLACAWQTHAAEVEAFVEIAHTSDLFRGKPFNDKDALQLDGLFGGITLTVGKRRAWEIDMSHGVHRIDRIRVEQASKLDVRFYPGRLR